MQDSQITFRFKADGIDEIRAQAEKLGVTLTRLTRNANGTFSGTGKLTSALDNQASSTNNVANATNRASKAQENYFLHIAKTTIQSALVNKVFLQMVESMGKAVQQVDLMQNFPAAMSALGLSSKDASESLLKLRDYIGSIGGDLTEATSSVARFAEVTKDVKAATAEFIGAKNALIAGGAGAQVQENALEQLTQAYSRGKPQLIEWRSLMVAMPAQLNQVAKAMNFSNAQALGEALTNDAVSMQDFVTELTRLSTGTGPIAQQAIARMQGIQFAANVMSNALTNGLAAIYQAIGRQNIIAFFNFLTQVITTLAAWAVVLINTLVTLFNIISKVFGGPQLARFTGETAEVANNLGNGASSAGEIADGLDDAGKSAKSLNKQLAAFDKMNVLNDKTSGSGGGSSSGGGGGSAGLDAGTAQQLEDIYNGISGKLQTASIWAKIFAGIIAGLAGMWFFTKAVGYMASFVNAIRTASGFAGELSSSLFKVGKTVGTFAASLGRGLLGLGSGGSGILGKAAQLGAKIGLAIRGGLAAAFSGVAGAVIAPVATALGVSFGVAAAIVIAVIAAIGVAIWLVWKNWDLVWSNIKKSASAVWNWWIDEFNFIKNLFLGIVSWFKDWGATVLVVLTYPFTLLVAYSINVTVAIANAFIWLWTTITSIWSGTYTWFKTNVWDRIVAIFSVASQWFKDQFLASWNAIVAIWSVAYTWFKDNVWDKIVILFSPVAQWFSSIFSSAWNGIKIVWNEVYGWFKSNVWDRLVGLFQPIDGFFKDRFQNAYNNATSTFSGLWYWFKVNVWDRIVSVFSSIGTAVADAITGTFRYVVNQTLRSVTTIINGLISSINWAIRTIRSLPGLGGLREVPSVSLPQLAKGGVITQATPVIAGEAGAEAIVPLENNTEWLDKIASKINSSGNGQPVQLTIQIGEETIVTKVIDLINEKTQMSGRNTILV